MATTVSMTMAGQFSTHVPGATAWQGILSGHVMWRGRAGLETNLHVVSDYLKK